MKKKYLLFLLIGGSFLFTQNTWCQSCVPTNLNNTIYNLSCGSLCRDINLQVPHLKSTSNYQLNSIAYNPLPFVVAGGTEDLIIYDDDQYSNVFDLPFAFCFYDSSYTKAVIGSNGLVTFDETNAASCSNAWMINGGFPLPGAGTTSQCDPDGPYYPRAAIMAAYSDLDPRTNPPDAANASPRNRKIQWRAEGMAPCRKFVVSFFNIGVYGDENAGSCGYDNPTTFQIIMYESTGLIEVFFLNKTCFSSTNAGNAIFGIQNYARDAAVVGAGRNATAWTAVNEGWRFTPSGGTSKFVGAELLTMGGVVLAFGDTATTVPGLLDINFPNFCPPAGTTRYIVRTTFGSCPAGTTMTSLDTITLIRNTTLPVTTGLTSTVCGSSTGSITVNVATGSGTTPYQFSLNGGALQASNIFNGLGAGIYSVFATDATGCDTTFLVTVISGTFLSSVVTQVNPVCANTNNGSINITPQAGSASPYTATLNGPGGPFSFTGNGTIVFSNLTAGVYNYSFTSANGCSGTGGPVTLITNSPLLITAATTSPLCNGNTNGGVSFNPSGGAAPYQYSRDAGSSYQASNVFTGLAAGTYTFRIRDNLGCGRDTVITLLQPLILNATAASTKTAGCSNNDGGITASANGGTVPYTYSLSGAATNVTGANNGRFTAVPSGNYTVTARDANACTATSNVTVTLVDNMFLLLGADTTICAGGSVLFNPQTNPETSVFTWRSTNAAISTINNPAVKNATATPADTARYILRAQWGTCVREDTIRVNVLLKPVANAGSDTAICDISFAILRGKAANVSGPVNYAWTPAANIEFPAQAITRVYPVGNNTSFTYTLTVTDNYGCNFSVSNQVNVRVQPPVPAFAGNDTIAVRSVPHQLFGTGGDRYLWSPSFPLNGPFNKNPLATLNSDTKFVLQVTDVAGCIGYDTVFVKVYAGPTYYIPNAFSPNGDGQNDIFRAIPVGIVNTEWFRIFNRYGEMVFQTNQWLRGWDGTYQGKKQAIGAYIWIIKGTDRNGKTVEMKGTVMLVQ